MLFRCEYRSPDKFLARNVRFKVEIIIDLNGQNANASASTSSTSSASSASTQSSTVLTNNININNQVKKGETTTPTQTRFKILFTLINGSTKQFHQLCKHIRTLISMNYSNTNNQSRQQRNAQQKTQTANMYTPSFQSNRTYQRCTAPNTPNLSSSIQHQQSPILNQRINQALINFNTPTSTTSGITAHNQPLSYQASPNQVSSRRNSNSIQASQPGSPSINSVIGNMVSSIQLSNDNTNKNSYINQSSLGSSLNSASHLVNSYVPIAQNTPINQNLTALLLSSSSGSSSSSSGTNTTTTPIQINGSNKSRKNSNSSLNNSPLINSQLSNQLMYQSANPTPQNGKKFS